MIYIMNENGDWWEHTPGEKLYVLDSKNIPAEYIEELANPDSWAYEPMPEEFERFGTTITLNLEGENK